MKNIILVVAACALLVACGSRFDGSSVENLLGNHHQDHPLNGDWVKLQSPAGTEVNRIHFDPVPSSSGRRTGNFVGLIENGTDVVAEFSWLTTPAYTFAGPIALTYDEGQLRDPPVYGRQITSDCQFEVSADRTQLDFGRGCELFRGSYAKLGEPLTYGDRLWRPAN